MRINGLLVVQEKTTDNKAIVVRRFRSLDEAELFVEERLATYERMWDGCGCKIDYYEEE